MAEPGQGGAHRGGGPPAHPGVHLVEDQHPGCVGQGQAHGQHGPGQLAARRRLGQRQGRLAGVGGQLEGDVVAAAVAPDPDGEPGRGHGQVVEGRLDLGGQQRGGPAPRPGHHRPRRRPPRPGPGRSRRRARRPGPRPPASAARRSRPSPAKARTSSRVSPVLALQLVQELAPGPDLLEPGGVVLPRLDHVAQLGGQVGRRSAMMPRTRRSSGSSGARPARAPDASASRSTAPGAARSPVGAGQGAEGGGGRGPVGRRLGQPLLLGLQGLLLVGPGEPGRLDLVHLEGQHLGLPGPLAGVATQALGLAQQGGQAGPGGLHRRRCRPPRRRRGPGAGPRARPGSGAGAGRAARAGRRRPRPARRAAPCRPSTQARDRPCAGHRPGQGDLVAAVDVGEPALDEGLVGAGPHHRRVGPAAEQQAEGPDQQRLAGPGLAGQGGHARPERRR